MIFQIQSFSKFPIDLISLCFPIYEFERFFDLLYYSFYDLKLFYIYINNINLYTIKYYRFETVGFSFFNNSCVKRLI